MINKLINFTILWLSLVLIGYLFISLIELSIYISSWRGYAHFILTMHITSMFIFCASKWDTDLYIRNVRSLKLEYPNYDDFIKVSRTGSISINPHTIIKSEQFKRQVECVRELSKKYPNGFKCDDFGGQVESCDRGNCDAKN